MPHPASSQDWHRFTRTALGAIVGVLLGYLALAYVIDPYDSGRSTLFSAGGVRPQGPRTAAASRGRDPDFTAAVIGNSHIQLVEPARLSGLTGIPFVQLSMPATGPGEQFVTLDWFLRHHPAPTALMFSADEYWCGDDPNLANPHPFPYWLFASGTGTYLRGLLRFSVAQETVERIGWLLKPQRKRAAKDGWWDYESNYLGLGYGKDPRLVAALERPAGDRPDPHKAGPFPAADRFRAALAAVPAETAVVLVFPPIYARAEAAAGSARAAAEGACRAGIADALALHPRSAVLDWRRDRPESHDPALFFDQNHYRLPLARSLTEAIAAAVNRLRAPGAAP